MIKVGKQGLDEVVDKMWNEIASCVKRLRIRVPTKDTWLWNEEVQAIVILKRE